MEKIKDARNNKLDREKLKDVRTLKDWEELQKKHLLHLSSDAVIFACACGSRKFHLLQSKTNVKTICSRCTASKIIYWMKNITDSSAGRIRNLETGNFE